MKHAAYTYRKEGKDLASEDLEIYEVGSTVILFRGVMGSKGVLVYGPDDRWEYYPCGSKEWDSLHQQVYRTHRGGALEKRELNSRGIRLPSAEELQYQTRGMKWEENFDSVVPMAMVPKKFLSKLKGHAHEQKAIYLVLYEDCYETNFGDGRYLYPEAAFWTESEAGEAITRLQKGETDSGKKEWYRYYVKEIAISVDESEKKVVADLRIESYEHYSLTDIIRLLAEKPAQKRDFPGE